MNQWVSVFISSLVYGLAMSIIAAFVLIPASYVGNRFIYHSQWMRAVLIGVASAGSVLLFILMLIGKLFGLQSVHYLGLLPLMNTTGNSLIDYFLRPLIQVDTDPVHVRESYQSLLLSPSERGSEKAVPEELYQQGRKLAAIHSLTEWAQNAGVSLETPVRSSTQREAAAAESQRPQRGSPDSPLVAPHLSSANLAHLGQEAQWLPGAAAEAQRLRGLGWMP